MKFCHDYLSWCCCYLFCAIAVIPCTSLHESVADGISFEMHKVQSRYATSVHTARFIALDSYVHSKNRKILFHQFLVHVNDNKYPEAYRYLNQTAAYFRHLTFNTFLVLTSLEHAYDIVNNDIFRGAYEFPQKMKLSFDFYQGQSIPQYYTRQRRADCSGGESIRSSLNVLIISTSISELPSLIDQINELCFDHSSNTTRCQVIREPCSKQKLIVDVNDCYLNEAARLLAEHPRVTWIELRGKMKLRNKYATRIVQSSNSTSWTLWANGLQGDSEVDTCIEVNDVSKSRSKPNNVSAQIIGITDTGVDYNSCFFKDDSVPLPHCVGEGYVDTPGCISLEHRKIVTYVSSRLRLAPSATLPPLCAAPSVHSVSGCSRASRLRFTGRAVYSPPPPPRPRASQRRFKDTDFGDTAEGHGTHVCGSALGAAAGPTSAAPAPDYNGMAPRARLAFDDISVNGVDLLLPGDLSAGLFPHPYAAGARWATGMPRATRSPAALARKQPTGSKVLRNPRELVCYHGTDCAIR